MRFLIVAFLMITMSRGVSAQVVNDLHDEIDAGNIVLVSAKGNGSSSGTAVEGYLTNKTAAVRRVNIYLTRPIYLVNSGRDQNMVASEVYYGDGDYLSDGRRPFIELEPSVQTAVRFVAYSVDFDKDNLSQVESFSIGNMPTNLNSVMASINAFAFANPSMDIAATAQIAIWLAQGENLEEIQSRIDFTETEEGLARYFIQ
ncbi:MAG: hypothetical protein O7H40_03540 [Gammaproteobacteria bacterium]|nr:hypothetical protein [Gammaproteobacteria bacterium]